ncbi:MAG: hypothetical protein JXR41_06875 [Bacteroidales bacterium]|nr:hypothetical protein [Bacteroidales bacterium]MBN2762795.1 hypothetical protein [Bacteroidales bacterium]
MNKKTKIPVIVVLLHLSYCFVTAQQNDSAYNYMATIGREYANITENYLSYSSAVAHSKSAKKSEHKRIDFIKSIGLARARIASMPAFRGNATFRDSVVSYLTLTYHVMNEDYGKIMDLEEIAEQSYDLMEAYYLAQDMASEKMRMASNKLNLIEKDFAARYNIQLSEQQSDISKKVETVNSVQRHYTQVYLILFKSHKQEAYLLEALNKKDMNAAEQNRNALLQTAVEGLSKLDTLSVYKNDRSLVTACRKALGFFSMEANDKMPAVIDYYLKADNFEKVRDAFEAIPQMARTQTDVEQYNKAVNEYNTASRSMNVINNSLNQSRTNVMNNWNTIADVYLQRHTPKAR